MEVEKERVRKRGTSWRWRRSHRDGGRGGSIYSWRGEGSYQAHRSGAE